MDLLSLETHTQAQQSNTGTHFELTPCIYSLLKKKKKGIKSSRLYWRIVILHDKKGWGYLVSMLNSLCSKVEIFDTGISTMSKCMIPNWQRRKLTLIDAGSWLSILRWGASITCSGEAVLPVPIAHTGSYASTTLLQSFTLSGAQRQASVRKRTIHTLLLRARAWFWVRVKVRWILNPALIGRRVH